MVRNDYRTSVISAKSKALKNQKMISGSQVLNRTNFQRAQKKVLIQTNILLNQSAVSQESSRKAPDR